ncbi:hypothetical protein UY3_02597 [Chelonia mydas]|uniref:Uncharacterized protein n=1 Tax=Chelonia mydas TaxID=8469 RepID=M7BWK0_CHEMY|nr:hypothetical protein UY3_02597 [Chelonia mydas]
MTWDPTVLRDVQTELKDGPFRKELPSQNCILFGAAEAPNTSSPRIQLQGFYFDSFLSNANSENKMFCTPNKGPAPQLVQISRANGPTPIHTKFKLQPLILLPLESMRALPLIRMTADLDSLYFKLDQEQLKIR